MMRIQFSAIALAACIAAAPACAQTYTLQTAGTIYSLVNSKGYSTDGRIVNGSPFTSTVTYNTSALVSSTKTVNNSQQSIYTLPISFSFTIGGYTASGSQSGILIINDNYDIGSGIIEDGVAFVANQGAQSGTPFTFDGQPVYTSFQVNSFDPNSLVLNSTGIDQVANYSLFPRQFITFDFVNSTFDNSVLLFGNVTSSSFYAGAPLAAAVPEPATWAMMILGMGAIGFAMRRRHRIATRVVFAV